MVRLALVLFLLMAVVCPVWAAVDFDGTDDLLSINDDDSTDFGTGDFTFSFWFYVDDGTTEEILISRWQNLDLVWDIRFGWGGGNASTVYIFSEGDPGIAVSAGSISNDAWHHIVCGRESGEMFGYLDGGSYFDGAADASNISGATAINLGKNTGYSNFLDGMLKEVAIWNVALTAAEANLLYNPVMHMPLQVRPGNLLMYWPLDDEEDGTSGDGDTFFDLSGNARNLTGNDGAGDAGLTCFGENVLSYP